MVNTRTVVTENTAVTISKKRMNGLILRTAQENRDHKSNMLDTILLNEGIEELEYDELISKAEKNGCLERVRKLLKEEVSS